MYQINYYKHVSYICIHMVTSCVTLHSPPLEDDPSPQSYNSLPRLRAKFQSNQSQLVREHVPVQGRYSSLAVSGGLHTETVSIVTNTTISEWNKG
jgi:hypothetical protein